MAEPALTFATLGEFRVRDPAGGDVTPRSQKACGLLAMLCDAPELRRPRAVLQDKLWSDRDQAQGAASLRQALSEIRKSFGAYRGALYADNRIVGLDPAAVSIDLHDRAARVEAARRGARFLEGIGVRDPEFEDWLRDRRLALEDAPASEREPAGAPRAQRTARPPALYLSVLPSGGQSLFTDHIVHAIAKGVQDVGSVELHESLAAEVDPDQPAYVLAAHEKPLGDGAALRIQLHTLADQRICWQETAILSPADLGDAGTTLMRIINRGTDRTSAIFAGQHVFGSLAAISPGAADAAAVLHRMWNTAGKNPGELMAALQAAHEQDGRGIHLAWQAFVWCFVVGERRQTATTSGDSERLIQRAIELEPHNPLVLALASHVYGFVLRRFGVSLELAERAVKLDRGNVLGWAFLGVARLNTGDKEGGYQATRRAREIAGEGPHRPFIDSLMTSLAALTGRADEAIALGETTHVMRPRFAAPLRYLLATYLAAGDLERARMTALRIREIEPDFEMALLAEPEYPVEPIRRSGIIQVGKLPKLI